VGTQYRSIILYADERQRKAAQQNWKDPVVTEIVPLAAFYRAEDYHQDSFDHNLATSSEGRRRWLDAGGPDGYRRGSWNGRSRPTRRCPCWRFWR